jgi:uncharacterized membrane protein HdeD (DUF308 family)
MFRLTAGIFGLWLLYGLVEVVIGRPPLFYTFRAFGLVSPIVGLFCLVFSLAALLNARRARAATWPSAAAIVLSLAIGVVPFFSLPFDPS